MGIESLSGITGTKTYQGQSQETISTKQIQVEGKTAGNMPAVMSQAEPASKVLEESTMHGSNTESQKEKQQEESAIKNAAKDINKIINRNTVAEFGYHEATNKITIKIKDRDTNEIIKEIPSEKALQMLEKAWEIAGILVDEKR